MAAASPSTTTGAAHSFTQRDFIPPFRFSAIEEGLFRGGYPTLRNFPFLKSIGIKTILSVAPEDSTYDLKEFCKAERIQIRYIQADRWKGEPQLLPTDINEALHVMINADLHPLFVHCLDGRHVVGLVVMALRKLQCWDYHAMQLEYERFTKESNNETAYISDYGGGFTLPPRIPSWLFGGTWLDHDGKPRKHPTLKVKYIAPSLQYGGNVVGSSSGITASQGTTTPVATVAAGQANNTNPSASGNPSSSSGANVLTGTSPTQPGSSNSGLKGTSLDVNIIMSTSAPPDVVGLPLSPVDKTPTTTNKSLSQTSSSSTPAASSVPSAAAPAVYIDVQNVSPVRVPVGKSSEAFSIVPLYDLQMFSVRSALCVAPKSAANQHEVSLQPQKLVMDFSGAAVAPATAQQSVVSATVQAPKKMKRSSSFDL